MNILISISKIGLVAGLLSMGVMVFLTILFYIMYRTSKNKVEHDLCVICFFYTIFCTVIAIISGLTLGAVKLFTSELYMNLTYEDKFGVIVMGFALVVSIFMAIYYFIKIIPYMLVMKVKVVEQKQKELKSGMEQE